MREGWEIKKLGECFNYIKNGANIKQTVGADGFPITRIETLSNGIFNSEKVGYANIYDLGKYSSYVLQDGDILMSHINSAKFLGRAVLYHEIKGKTFIHGMNLLRLKCVLNIVCPDYCTYFFKSFFFKDQVASITKKAVNQASFSITALKELDLIVPPLSEQSHIVAELDLLNGIIEKKRQQLKELDALSQSIFYDMFGDPVSNEKGYKIGDVCKTSSGGTPSKSKREYYENGDIPWLRSGEVNNICITQTELCITEEGMKNSSAKYFPKDTVVIAMYGATVGQVGILNRQMTTNQAVCGIFPNSYFEPLYLYFFLKSKKDDYISMAAGGAQPNISQAIIRNTYVACPPLALQQKFASRIALIEQQKQLIQSSLSETETLLNSRMDYYFN